MLIDAHCHLHDREFFSGWQAREMLMRAGKVGVEKVICVGTNMDDSMAAAQFANERYEGVAFDWPEVHWTLGSHPENAKDRMAVRDEVGMAKNMLTMLHDLSMARPDMSAKPVAVGEVGLDYHCEDYNRTAQIRLLEEMLQLADRYELPVVFHVREAFNDFFPVVARFPRVRGVVHSFSGNKKELRRILTETQFYVGVNGMITYMTLPVPPLERAILETDAPFLTPEPFRGIINEPAYVREVAERLALKFGISIKTVERETSKNARRLFQI